jgi:hypothetical protein
MVNIRRTLIVLCGEYYPHDPNLTGSALPIITPSLFLLLFWCENVFFFFCLLIFKKNTKTLNKMQ